MIRRVHIDFETRSDLELVGARGVGAYRYAESPHTGAWGFSWGFDKFNMRRWRPGYPDPDELLDHIAMGGPVVAHNAAFERIFWALIRARYKLGHWPQLFIWQQDCTMARSMQMNLPASLENVGIVLGLKEQKDIEGAALMKKMSKPRGKPGTNGEYKWWDEPQNLDRLEIYQDQDVRTEIEADDVLLPLPPFERLVWELDQKINDRGIPLDIRTVIEAVTVVEYAKREADKRMAKITNGYVQKCSEVAKIAEWITQRGFKCDTFRKEDHADLLMLAKYAGDKDIRDVVELRRDAGKTSTSKFERMLDCVSADDRSRGLFVYCGAKQTKRWASRLWQSQNLKRFDPDREGEAVKFCINILNAPISTRDKYELLAMAFKAPVDMLSKCARPVVKSEDGHEFIGADYSNVEGRINAWLAGEAWKVQAFLDFDAKVGPDLYKLAFSNAFGKSVEAIEYEERQVGKVMELSFGFQGGVNAFITNCDKAQPPMKPAQVVEPVRNAVDAVKWFQVRELYDAATDKCDLLQDEWTAVKIIVRGWRDSNSMIKGGWYELQDAAIQAVSEPYSQFTAYSGRVSYLYDGSNLYCQLPDGSVLFYNQAFLRYQVTEYVEIAGRWIDTVEFFPFELELMRQQGARFKQQGRNVVFYHNEVNQQWIPEALYGGLQCENIVQGTGRAILARAMLNVEAHGYPIVMHTHDDILTQVREGTGDVKEFEQLMLAPLREPWMHGMPLAVKGWRGERYGFK